MVEADPAYEKKVKLKRLLPEHDVEESIDLLSDKIPGVIDIEFKGEFVILHYNNNATSIDMLVQFLKTNKVELCDSLINKLKLRFHGFIDANARSNAAAKPGCCAKADEICKEVEKTKNN